jgi:two-component system, cell cycle response regulator
VPDLPRILIVDKAKSSRAVLIQHLASHYDVREAEDGDAAWEALVLDHSIRAVVSDLLIPKMSAYQLVERLRFSRLRHLQQMPFVLVLDEGAEEERSRARTLGVSDFVGVGAGAVELLSRLRNLLALPQSREPMDQGREHMVHDPVSGLFTRKYLELQAAQALSHSARHGIDVSVMVIGFDSYAKLCEMLGPVMAEEVGTRFTKMLAAKVRQEDSLGHLISGQYAVVSPGTALTHCGSFAERVRQAVEVSKVTVKGQVFSLTVSIGLAGVPADRVTSAGALLDLAGQRMKLAMESGGNRVAVGGSLPATKPISLAHALELLEANRSEQVSPHLDVLLAQLMPLLALMDKELNLALPMVELERYLGERTPKQK